MTETDKYFPALADALTREDYRSAALDNDIPVEEFDSYIRSVREEFTPEDYQKLIAVAFRMYLESRTDFRIINLFAIQHILSKPEYSKKIDKFWFPSAVLENDGQLLDYIMDSSRLTLREYFEKEHRAYFVPIVTCSLELPHYKHSLSLTERNVYLAESDIAYYKNHTDNYFYTPGKFQNGLNVNDIKNRRMRFVVEGKRQTVFTHMSLLEKLLFPKISKLKAYPEFYADDVTHYHYMDKMKELTKPLWDALNLIIDRVNELAGYE